MYFMFISIKTTGSTYRIIPKLQRSHFLSYEKDSPTQASTTSGAMYSTEPTGVKSSGVVQLSSAWLTGTPLAKSKSQILIGTTSSVRSHRMLSGLRSLCAIPENWRRAQYHWCVKWVIPISQYHVHLDGHFILKLRYMNYPCNQWLQYSND